MADNKAQALREKVQSEIVALITDKLKSGEMGQDRAKEIAKLVLEKLPENMTYQELIKVIPKLDDQFHELSDVVVPIMTEYEKKLKVVLEEKVLKLVRDKKFKEAIMEAQKAIEIEKHLS